MVQQKLLLANVARHWKIMVRANFFLIADLKVFNWSKIIQQIKKRYPLFYIYNSILQHLHIHWKDLTNN